MIGLTIGTGSWYKVAQRAAARMASMTGLECHVVNRVDSNLAHPSWHKLNLLRDYPGETLFIFDADMWCMKEWDPTYYTDPDHGADFPGLAMVPEPVIPRVRLESVLYHIPIGRYCNTGLLVADARAKEVFAAAKKLHPSYGSWLEQTSLVATVESMRFPVTHLPATYNTLVPAAASVEAIRATGATVVHMAGTKTVERLHELFDSLT
jgi:hypothetical protein